MSVAAPVSALVAAALPVLVGAFSEGLPGWGTLIGFGLALIILAGIREQLELVDVPKGMKGVSLSLVIAGILAMAFMGFTGIVK
jgi:Na+-translocating ferredoxin:NAD+ oxidoreductase RnfA subunit